MSVRKSTTGPAAGSQAPANATSGTVAGTANMSLAFRIARPFAVLVVTLLLAASSIVMVGPQTLLIVPVAIGLGIVFAVRRSFWSLICLGYPFLFGFVSAWIGCKEMPGYHQTMAFVISVCVGMIGVGLVATGIWKVLPGSGASAN